MPVSPPDTSDQPLTEIVPRVRRAVEGPVPLVTGALTDDQLEAMAADSIADIILVTVGRWGHKLVALEVDPTTNVPLHWGVEPGLQFEEESVVAAQAALTQLFHQVKDMKVSETIQNEGQSWDWEKSATVIRDQMAELKDMRDLALNALLAENPVISRYVSFLETRDRLASVLLEPWTSPGGGVGGGQVIFP